MHVSYTDEQTGFLIVECCVIYSWFSNGRTAVFSRYLGFRFLGLVVEYIS